MAEQKIAAVAMSGGVDSTAAAILLQQQGYKVIGLTMELLKPPYMPQVESIRDAGKVAAKLGIEHHYLDYRELFADKVVDYFTESYVKGLTPSPCIMCNRFVKLGALADKARELGAEVLVTGHYAEVRQTPHGAELHRAKDLVRDQSYFLLGIEKRNLEMLRCPLAEMSKDETRDLLKAADIEIYQKADSQDICFVSNGKYVELIQKLRPDYALKKGDIVTSDGKVLGQHNGIINYTVGQRRGLGIGGGPIEAATAALHKCGAVPEFQLEEYSEHALGRGATAQAAAYVGIRDNSGRTVYGVGIDRNINLAAIRAIVNAINHTLEA